MGLNLANVLVGVGSEYRPFRSHLGVETPTVREEALVPEQETLLGTKICMPSISPRAEGLYLGGLQKQTRFRFTGTSTDDWELHP